MKKFIIILASIIVTLPATATCKIDDATACKIAIRQPYQRYYTNTIVNGATRSQNLKINSNLHSTIEKELRKFGPQPSDYNYNTSCQFGICNESGVPKLFEQRQVK